MDYQEAIKEAEIQIDMYESILYNKDFEPKNDNSNYERKLDFLKTAISAMQELQALHDQGLSLERLKDIDFRKDVVEHINYDVYMSLMDELEEYREIGTLEEVREAVEKQKAKKSIDIRGDKLKFCTCPYCGRRITDVEGGNYCQNCGQALDWSEVDR